MVILYAVIADIFKFSLRDTSRAWVPIEPVEPKIDIFLTILTSYIIITVNSVTT